MPTSKLHLLITLIVFWACTSVVMGQNELVYFPKNDSLLVLPGERGTLVIGIQNSGNESTNLRPNLILSSGWNAITQSPATTLKPLERKNFFFTFLVPPTQKPGYNNHEITFLDDGGKEVYRASFTTIVDVVHSVKVRLLHAPQYIQAGDTIVSTFEIRNSGNVPEKLEVSSKSNLQKENTITLQPEETYVTTIQKPTRSKEKGLKSLGTNIIVKNDSVGIFQKAFGSTKVFPTRIEAEDAYFRFPVEASLFYNSFQTPNFLVNSMFFEARGNGWLDLPQNNYIDFIIRAPNQSRASRFGIADQYSLIYKHKKETTVYLGDHTFNINRLGFMGRYGFGGKIDHTIGKTTLTGFYSKPRIFNFTSEPIFGAKINYASSNLLNFGFAISNSKEIALFNNFQTVKSSNKLGSVGVFEVNYKDDRTQIMSELATSIFDGQTDQAADLYINHRIGRLNYNGNATIAGEKFIGTLNNSLRYSNALSYSLNKWVFGLGQNYSKVFERRDTTLYGIQPFFENYYSSVGYRLKRNHFFSLRVNYRNRQDLSPERSFDYSENGVDYKYKFTSKKVSLNINGRIANTLNLLGEDAIRRKTYGHLLGLRYTVSREFSFRGNFNHNRTSRYSRKNEILDFYLFGGGINYSKRQELNISASYNSGFSPEEAYRKRDFLNAKIASRIGKHHQIEARVNYYISPNTVDQRETFAFLKYTYRFGVPLKKIRKQGGIIGKVYSNNPDVNVKGIQLIAKGNVVRTDKNGNFEMNNLPEGNNLLILDQSTLPRNVVLKREMPLTVRVTEKEKAPINIEVCLSVSVDGRISCLDTTKQYILSGYVKLYNDEFSYFMETQDDGSFSFKNIVPGKYTLSLLRLKTPSTLVAVNQKIVIDATTSQKDIAFEMRPKQRVIKFKRTKFKLK